jgi:hypothetical protein
LDEVKEPKTTSHILLGNRYNETEVSFCEALTSILDSLLYEVTEANFFFCINEWKSSYLIEIHAYRVI